MKIGKGEAAKYALIVTWEDGTRSEFPWIWLRDNDVAELHPHTRERTFDLTTVAIDVAPTRCDVDQGGVGIVWPDREEPARYPCGWLYAHRPGQRRADPARIARTLWDGKSPGEIARFSAPHCMRSDVCLREALRGLKRLGLILVQDLDDELGAGEAFGLRVGFRRQTNFGRHFDVELKHDPNNLAYTSVALPLHSDLTNQELMPGYQFLHCYRNSVSGGESVFADGFRIAQDLRRQRPDCFELLCNTPMPHRFHDAKYDIRSRRAAITLDADGELKEFALNAHIADVPDMDPATLPDFYAAYQHLMRRCRDPRYAVRHQLRPGQMVVFDNRRVLHGRDAFSPAGDGQRHLRGYYIDRTELDSRLRMIA